VQLISTMSSKPKSIRLSKLCVALLFTEQATSLSGDGMMQSIRAVSHRRRLPKAVVASMSRVESLVPFMSRPDWEDTEFASDSKTSSDTEPSPSSSSYYPTASFIATQNVPPELLATLRPHSACRVDQMSSTDLAYIGDAVYELLVRSHCVWPSKRTSDLQLQVVSLVRAKHQALLLAKLKQCDQFSLTKTELQVVSRGRNAVTKSSKNRRGDPAAYQDATALEALLGYLYITDLERCRDLMQWIKNNLES